MTHAIEWLSTPKDGETENGDTVIVRRDGERALMVVIDALGHGPHAARVARAAADAVDALPFPESALLVVDTIHERLRGTRGAAGLVCLAFVDRIEGCSVGNVEMRCTQSRLPIVLTPGIIGTQMKRPRVFGGDIRGGQRLVIFSDGVSSRFSLQETRALSPGDACRAIFAGCRRAHDDATVLVADLRSGDP